MKSKLFKKLIAAGAAAAMVSQLGFVIPASAATIYSQDYESVTSIADVWTSQNAQTNLQLLTDRTNYANYTNDLTGSGGARQKSRSSYSDFTVDLTGKTSYVIEFDLAVNSGSQDATQFAIRTGAIPKANSTLTGDYILNMTVPANSTTWTINDVATSTVNIPASEWCHYTYYVDHSKSLATLTIEGETSGMVADKMVVAAPAEVKNITGLYYLNGRYYANMSIDNIVVRDVEADDVFGEVGAEVMADIDIVSQPTIINQPAEGTTNEAAITLKVNGSLGGDLTEDATYEWSWIGNDTDDGYVVMTPNDETLNITVRNGVSNHYIVATAAVTYGEVTQTVAVPFAVIGATAKDANQLIPDLGYPESMDDLPDSLVGYVGTANGINSKDLILNNWSIYGSNAARTMKLVEMEGRKALEFASNGGGGTTLSVYQWPAQQNQYIVDMTIMPADGSNYGIYTNTPNNANAVAEWTFTCSGGTLNAGTESISGVNAGEWTRVLVSADPSVGTYSVTAYDAEGALLGTISDVVIPENTSGKSAVYLCVSGTMPSYLNAISEYIPTADTVEVVSSADVVRVPETEGEVETLDFTANCATEDGVKVTGAVTWSLADEYAGVELVPTGAQTAELRVSAGASGSVEVTAVRDGVSASKTVQLTTSSDVVSFTDSTSSITIPFEGEESIVENFEAVTLDKDGNVVEGKTITYDLLASDGVNPASLKGVTFENGVLTVEAGANPGIVYVRATNSDGLVNRVRVNIHGMMFAFGSGEPEEGYTQVTNDVYTERLGYGFVDASALTVNETDVTGSADYRFKATVPNGNYVVEVETTAASMTSEVVESVPATTGITKQGANFQVAVCDGVLDLTFPAESSVSKIEISQTAAKTPLDKPKVYAVGDSTTANSGAIANDPQGRSYCSWGNSVTNGTTAVPDTFSGFANHGMAGRDSVNFYNQGRMEAVLLSVNPGDYVTINMGINSREAGEGDSFYTLIKDYYVQGVIQRGATPIILTATADGPGYSNSAGTYDEATGHFSIACPDRARNPVLRQIAEELGLHVIDMGQFGEDYINSLTMDDVEAFNTEYDKDFQSVFELVQYLYPDHNHYIEPLASVYATYALSEVEKIANGEIEEPDKPLTVTFGTATAADGKITVPVTTEGEGSLDVNLIAAQYDADGNLVKTDIANVTVTEATTSVTVDSAMESATTLYIWDADMTPLANAQDVAAE